MLEWGQVCFHLFMTKVWKADLFSGFPDVPTNLAHSTTRWAAFHPRFVSFSGSWMSGYPNNGRVSTKPNSLMVKPPTRRKERQSWRVRSEETEVGGWRTAWLRIPDGRITSRVCVQRLGPLTKLQEFRGLKCTSIEAHRPSFQSPHPLPSLLASFRGEKTAFFPRLSISDLLGHAVVSLKSARPTTRRRSLCKPPRSASLSLTFLCLRRSSVRCLHHFWR